MTGIGIGAETENSERNDEKDAMNETEARVSEKNDTRNTAKIDIELES